jgi:hypothetical protein
MKLIAQIAITVFLLLGFVINLYQDCEGRSAKAPRGFGAVIETIIISFLIFVLYWQAGLLSEFTK